MANELLGHLQAIEAFNLSKKAALDKVDALLASIGHREMTAEEQSQYDAGIAEAKGSQKMLDAYRQRAMAGNIPTDTDPAPAPAPAPASGQRVPIGAIETRENKLDQPWGWTLLGDKCLPQTGESKQDRLARVETCFGDYLFTMGKALEARNIGQLPDPRLVAANAAFARRASIAPAGSSEMVPSDGGFLVDPDFVNQLLELVHQTGVVYPMVRHIPLSEYTNSVKIPAVDEQSRKDGYRNGGVQAFWENEAQSLSGSKPTFALIELVTVKLTGLYYATNEVLADARLLGNFAMQAFGEEFGFKLDDGIIEGTGAGQLFGILNAKCVVQISKESNQGAGTVNFTNVLKMWGQMYARGRRTSIWLINQTVEPQLNQLSQVVGTGGVPVFLPNGTALFSAAVAQLQCSVDEIAGMSGILLGRPVYVIEQASVVGTVGDIILFDPTQYLMIDKGAVQAASSMHVRFLTDEMTYRWVLRVGGQIWWKTALTAFKGTTTYSPIITLATRS